MGAAKEALDTTDEASAMSANGNGKPRVLTPGPHTLPGPTVDLQLVACSPKT